MSLRRQPIVRLEPLEAQSLTSSTDNSTLDVSGSDKSVGVGHRCQGSGLSSVLVITEVIVVGDGIAVIGRVERLAGANEGVGLDKDLGTVTSIDSVVGAVKVAVVDVTSAKAN